jgi:hypothetical protein
MIALLAPSGRCTLAIKETVALAIRRREVTVDQVIAAHPNTSAEELEGWVERYAAHGRAGLSICHLQEVGR